MMPHDERGRPGKGALITLSDSSAGQVARGHQHSRGPWRVPATVRHALDGVSWDALALWWSVQTYLAADASPNGVLPKRRLEVAVCRRIKAARLATATAELVAAGLWEDIGDEIRSTVWDLSQDLSIAGAGTLVDAIADALRDEAFDVTPGACRWDRATCPPAIHHGAGKLRAVTHLGHLVDQTSSSDGELIRARWCSGLTLVRGADRVWAILARGRQ